MIDNCKTEAELRSFCSAQAKTMNTIMKKNKELNDEIEHLKSLVAGAVPIIKIEGESELKVGSDQEEIAKIEIRKLRDRSYGKEPLMLEEAKRLEIYTKILLSSATKIKPGEREVKELNSDELMLLVGNLVPEVKEE